MTNDELGLEIRQWFLAAVDEHESAPPALRTALSSIVTTPGPAGVFRDWRGPALLAAAALALALVGSAIAVGSGIIRLPAVAPSPYKSSTFTPSPSLAFEALIAYTRVAEIWPPTCPTAGPGVHCPEAHEVSELWTIRADGADPHSLFPDRPDAVIRLDGWSASGARLLFSEAGSQFQADPTGGHLERLAPIDTGCSAPCTGDGFGSLSADGGKAVFIRSLASGKSLVAWIDIASDRVTELDSTRTSAPIAGPRWSPDGTRILYSASGKFNGDNVVYVVDIGGGSLHRVNPSALPARSAGWSPDGNLIVFSSFDDRTVGVPGDGEHAALVRDIYTIRPDGTGLQQLTTDGVSRGGSWTPDGRILFVRVPLDSANSPTGDPSSGFWTIAADGGDLQQVPDSSTAITPDTYFDDALAFWQPKP